MAAENKSGTNGDDLSGRIFTASTSMVGICLTGVGLFRISDRLKSVSTFANELLALDAAGFLVSCFLAYWALKAQHPRRRMSLEKVADVVFLAALCMMVAIAGFIAYEYL